MPVKVITTEFGHSIPPASPHNITINATGWDAVMKVRAADPSVMSRLPNIYPRFAPWGVTKQFSLAVAKKLDLPENYGCIIFPSPDIFAVARSYGTSPKRPDDFRLKGPQLLFRAVQVRGVRLYVVAYPLAKAPGIMGVWQNPGIGVSTRLSEEMLGDVEEEGEGDEEEEEAGGLKVLAWAADGDTLDDGTVPEPTYLPEVDAHERLRERIVELLQRAALEPAIADKVRPDDVYLYPTGMAAIHRLHLAMMDARKGQVVVLGSVFHNTWFLFDESPYGFKHFGPCGADSGVMDKLEAYLQGEAKEGRTISYVFVEFPSNPVLISVDLFRLRELADKYDFVLVADDTVGSFSNIDVLPAADIVLSSLTKSFSGYANVMGGSVVLSPSSPRYARLKPVFARRHRNELFSSDAAKLLSNSADYLARSAILNRNAAALAAHVHAQLVSDPASPVVAVLYPPYSDTAAHYRRVMRRPTAAFAPAHGCLLALDFETKDLARVFFDNLAAYHGPHLGAHELLAMPFNEAIWGKFKALSEYHQGYGLRGEQIRVSVGLESEEDTIDTFDYALGKAAEAKRVMGGGAGNGGDKEVKEPGVNGLK